MEDSELIFDFKNSCFIQRVGLINYYLPFDNIYVCLAVSYFYR